MFAAVPRRYVLALFTVATSVGALHCSSERGGFEGTKDAGSQVVEPFVDASTSIDGGIPEPLPDCADENKLIYVLSRKDKELFRFDPVGLTFASIGKLRCPTSSDTFSMAVDRRGTAWVEYGDGRIFNVSTKDATCLPTAYRPGQHEFSNFGMGFAKDDNDGGPLSETLYIAGVTLGKLDLSNFEVSLVGTTSYGQGELTGTGAGTLYAFLATGSRIVRLDKTTGTILETYRPDVDIGEGYAVAQWGGDFWLFTAPRNSRTTVTRYSPATNTSTVVIEDTGMMIIGAGSSTCAPAEGPH
jgi:hypothetical protein